MKKIIKWTAIILGGFIGLILIASFILYNSGKKKLLKSYPNIAVEPIKISTDGIAIARGNHISVIWGCTNCHGEDLSGRLFTKDPLGGNIPLFGAIPASNLTSGKGGIANFYTDVDWIRAIRYGIKPNNKRAVFMNATSMSDQDLGDLIGYLKQIPPIDRDSLTVKYGPIVPIALSIGILKPLKESVDHNAQSTSNLTPNGNIEYGKYLSAICTQCHGNDIAGKIKNWKQEDFIRAFQTSVLPNSKQFGPTMSLKNFREMNEVELTSLWLYFRNHGLRG